MQPTVLHGSAAMPGAMRWCTTVACYPVESAPTGTGPGSFHTLNVQHPGYYLVLPHPSETQALPSSSQGPHDPAKKWPRVDKCPPPHANANAIYIVLANPMHPT